MTRSGVQSSPAAPAAFPCRCETALCPGDLGKKEGEDGARPLPRHLGDMSMQPQQRVRSVEALVSSLRALPTPPRIIAIDGLPGAGKTALGKRLAERMSCIQLDTDDFVRPGVGAYVDRLCLDDLLTKIGEASHLMVLTGIFMRDITLKLSIGEPVNLYVKRMTNTGWFDGDYIYNIYSKIEYDLDDSELNLWKGLRDYHLKHRPDALADVVFERLD